MTGVERVIAVNARGQAWYRPHAGFTQMDAIERCVLSPGCITVLERTETMKRVRNQYGQLHTITVTDGGIYYDGRLY